MRTIISGAINRIMYLVSTLIFLVHTGMMMILEWADTEASTGRYDAMTGLLMKGDGKGNFTSVKSAATGFKADGDVKSLVQIFSPQGIATVLAGNNSAPMGAYELQKNQQIVPVKNNDRYTVISKRNGQSYRQEFYYGSNYLSQTSRMLRVGKDVISIIIYDSNSNRREAVPNQ